MRGRLLPLLVVVGLPLPASFQVREDADSIRVQGAALDFAIVKQGYVSGVAAGSLVDKKTGARDAGFGLAIVDWVMEAGSDLAHRSQLRPRMVYEYGNLVHGDIPKRIVEGPQICTEAGRLSPVLIRGRRFVAVQTRYQYRYAMPGRVAGSEWRQTLVFPEGKRWFLASDSVTLANDGEEVFVRTDLPGHIRHTQGDTFEEIYLSYYGRIPSTEFALDFPPDARFRYRRGEQPLPGRFIRAYKLRNGPWLAGMTLHPRSVYEAWCHQRGYVCMIQEFGGRRVRKGESLRAAYLIGYFDSIEEMERVYDEYAGHDGLFAGADGWRLLKPGEPAPPAALPGQARFGELQLRLFRVRGVDGHSGMRESWPLRLGSQGWETADEPWRRAAVVEIGGP